MEQNIDEPRGMLFTSAEGASSYLETLNKKINSLNQTLDYPQTINSNQYLKDLNQILQDFNIFLNSASLEIERNEKQMKKLIERVQNDENLSKMEIEGTQSNQSKLENLTILVNKLQDQIIDVDKNYNLKYEEKNNTIIELQKRTSELELNQNEIRIFVDSLNKEIKSIQENYKKIDENFLNNLTEIKSQFTENFEQIKTDIRTEIEKNNKLINDTYVSNVQIKQIQENIANYINIEILPKINTLTNEISKLDNNYKKQIEDLIALVQQTNNLIGNNDEKIENIQKNLDIIDNNIDERINKKINLNLNDLVSSDIYQSGIDNINNQIKDLRDNNGKLVDANQNLLNQFDNINSILSKFDVNKINDVEELKKRLLVLEDKFGQQTDLVKEINSLRSHIENLESKDYLTQNIFNEKIKDLNNNLGKEYSEPIKNLQNQIEKINQSFENLNNDNLQKTIKEIQDQMNTFQLKGDYVQQGTFVELQNSVNTIKQNIDNLPKNYDESKIVDLQINIKQMNDKMQILISNNDTTNKNIEQINNYLNQIGNIEPKNYDKQITELKQQILDVDNKFKNYQLSGDFISKNEYSNEINKLNDRLNNLNNVYQQKGEYLDKETLNTLNEQINKLSTIYDQKEKYLTASDIIQLNEDLNEIKLKLKELQPNDKYLTASDIDQIKNDLIIMNSKLNDFQLKGNYLTATDINQIRDELLSTKSQLKELQNKEGKYLTPTDKTDLENELFRIESLLGNFQPKDKYLTATDMDKVNSELLSINNELNKLQNNEDKYVTRDNLKILINTIDDMKNQLTKFQPVGDYLTENNLIDLKTNMQNIGKKLENFDENKYLTNANFENSIKRIIDELSEMKKSNEQNQNLTNNNIENIKKESSLLIKNLEASQQIQKEIIEKINSLDLKMNYLENNFQPKGQYITEEKFQGLNNDFQTMKKEFENNKINYNNDQNLLEDKINNLQFQPVGDYLTQDSLNDIKKNITDLNSKFETLSKNLSEELIKKNVELSNRINLIEKESIKTRLDKLDKLYETLNSEKISNQNLDLFKNQILEIVKTNVDSGSQTILSLTENQKKIQEQLNNMNNLSESMNKLDQLESNMNNLNEKINKIQDNTNLSNATFGNQISEINKNLLDIKNQMKNLPFPKSQEDKLNSFIDNFNIFENKLNELEQKIKYMDNTIKQQPSQSFQNNNPNNLDLNNLLLSIKKLENKVDLINKKIMHIDEIESDVTKMNRIYKLLARSQMYQLLKDSNIYQYI